MKNAQTKTHATFDDLPLFLPVVAHFLYARILSVEVDDIRRNA